MSDSLKVLILPGDGIGPEIIENALRVFESVKPLSKHSFDLSYASVGGEAFDKFGSHFPDDTKDSCLNSDVILFAAVGGPVSQQHEPKWKNCETNSILALRRLLDLYANVRPIKVDSALVEKSPLRLEKFLPKTPDFLIVRELSGDIYYGKKYRESEPEVTAYDECSYSTTQIRRIAQFAFELAKKRTKVVHSVDKANVLETSKLWRELVTAEANNFHEIKLESMLVDNCAMQLITRPTDFDVIVTSNMFGDILSDAAAVIPGSLGLLASASYGSSSKWLFEPPSGSAPDIAGKNIVNPVGMIRSVALMFLMATNEPEIYNKIESAITKTFAAGVFTKDICKSDEKFCSTSDFTSALIENL